MKSNAIVEHFVTLFDLSYLPMGLALHTSLAAHAQPFHLWIVCIDNSVEAYLLKIDLPFTTLIPLSEIETARMLTVKSDRTRGEYCWTVTPFAPQAVFDRAPEVKRVTYLDSDVFFYDDPRRLLAELDEAGKHVLITEHAYAPEYNKGLENGRFCVQFLTFRNTLQGRGVMKWWQERCLEWCYARSEDGKFGDQKYLDVWPELFADDVHIVCQTDKTLAPWNVRYFDKKLGGKLTPVFYHFHGLRIISAEQIMLYNRYKIGKQGKELYSSYVDALIKCLTILHNKCIPVPFITPQKETWAILRLLKRKVTGIVAYYSY